MVELTGLACQIDIPPTRSLAESEQHLHRVATRIDDTLQRRKAHLVVLPELSSIDYSRQAFCNLQELAEPAQGRSFRLWSELAIKHKVVVVYGFAAMINSGFTIATAVVGKDGGLVGVYHKLHLAQFGDSMEKEYFTRGHQRLVVFEVNGFKVAPIICYDIRAPELCRTLAVDHHVDVILHTGAYARDPSFFSWHDFARTRAIENQLYFVSVNRAGHHFGRSIICPPWIDEKHSSSLLDESAEEFHFFNLYQEEIVKARTDYTFLQDRLDSYSFPVDGA